MKNLFFLLLFFFCFYNLSSQGSMKIRKWRKTEVDSLNKAQALFEESNYLTALPIFEKLLDNHPKELYLKYVTGISSLYKGDKHDKALEYLLAVYAKNKKVFEIEYDLARAYHLNYKFEEAIAILNKFNARKKTTDEQKKKTQQIIDYCNNGIAFMSSPTDSKIANIGDVINTNNSEYVPVLNANESVLIFTYRGEKSWGALQNAYNQPDEKGEYYEDVFITRKEKGNWTNPVSIGDNINTIYHDAAIALSNDGQKLFIFKNSQYDAGDIYMSRLDSSNWTTPEKLTGEINTNYWEGSCALSSDEKTLYFSSERMGGFGGKDIYQASLLADGTWGDVKNLGPEINTAFDEDAPFIHPDGKLLIYSSKGLNSMGGYDIFQTNYNEITRAWSKPENLGYPINTPDDDRYFVLSADGKRGYYASEKSEGYGLQDIYLVDVGNAIKKQPVVMIVTGFVTLNDKPVKSEIKVEISTKNKLYGSYNSNAVTGNYLLTLPAGNNYKITYKYPGLADKTEEIDAKNMTNYSEKKLSINFTNKIDSTLIKDSLLAKVDSSKAMLPVKSAIPDIKNSTKEGLEFKVQIAAFTSPKNYTYYHLRGLGKIEKLLLEDGITRVTIGGAFKTLAEATEQKDKVKAAGQKDAFVTAIYNGKRIYLEDLIKLGLIPPKEKK